MGVITRAKKRRLEEEKELVVDRISDLPDGVLGDIVSLLPTNDGARTQVLSSRWRRLWRSAPLNADFHKPWQRTPDSDISYVLSAHPGPGRRFSVHTDRSAAMTTTELDGWLRSSTLDGLRELDIHFGRDLYRWDTQPLPASVLRFSSTLAVANFGACVFPDGNTTIPVIPLLQQLTLAQVRISEASLHALLAGCPALESLLLLNNEGCRRVKIASPSLRSISVGSSWREEDLRLRQLVIEDAPCLERLVFVKCFIGIDISVVSAPRLGLLGELDGWCHRFQFGTTALHQGLTCLTAVVPSVRVLALSYEKLDGVINLMRCFPHLEKLYIERTSHTREKHVPCHKYCKLNGTLDIRLRKIVLPYYQDSNSHINFAKFFVRNASMLQSMRLELQLGNVGNDEWIRGQCRLLLIEKRASRSARFDFVSQDGLFSLPPEEQVHDLLILDPFQKSHH